MVPQIGERWRERCFAARIEAFFGRLETCFDDVVLC